MLSHMHVGLSWMYQLYILLERGRECQCHINIIIILGSCSVCPYLFVRAEKIPTYVCTMYVAICVTSFMCFAHMCNVYVLDTVSISQGKTRYWVKLSANQSYHCMMDLKEQRSPCSKWLRWLMRSFSVHHCSRYKNSIFRKIIIAFSW